MERDLFSDLELTDLETETVLIGDENDKVKALSLFFQAEKAKAAAKCTIFPYITAKQWFYGLIVEIAADRRQRAADRLNAIKIINELLLMDNNGEEENNMPFVVINDERFLI